VDKPRWILLICAVLVIAAGLFPMLDALDVFPDSASRMNAPRWVVLVAASLFVFAGMYVLLLAVAGEAKAKAFGSVLGLAVFLGLAAVSHWVAFGEGDRSDCSGGISALGIGVSSAASGLECRGAFGYGAVLMDLLFLRGSAWWIAQRYPGSRFVRILEKISEWGIGLLLLPLLLLALLLGRRKDGVSRIADRLRSRTGAGKPPSQSP
jgi:hypothetical protein